MYTPIFKLRKVTQLRMISHNLEIEMGRDKPASNT